MIHPITMYAATCDNCGEEWMNEELGYTVFDSEYQAKETLLFDDWHTTDDGKTYCDKCYSWGDNDELILNAERQKNK